MRSCDHVFIAVKGITKTEPTQVNNESTAKIEAGTIIPGKFGTLVVCAYCGERREVYEDGELITHRAEK